VLLLVRLHICSPGPEDTGGGLQKNVKYSQTLDTLTYWLTHEVVVSKLGMSNKARQQGKAATRPYAF
jgi:hypothetical protein